MIEAVFLGAFLPMIFLVFILKGGNRLLMAFFAWGLVAFALSFFADDMLYKWFALTPEQLSVTWAPIVEEFLKALPLLYFVFNKKNSAYPVIYFAMASGIGFSIQENYLYITDYFGQQGASLFFIVIRSITTCLMHGVSTAIVGYGLQVIRKHKRMIFPLLFGLFTVAVTLHALFNLLLDSEVKLIGMLLPVGLFALGSFLVFSEDEPKDTGTH